MLQINSGKLFTRRVGRRNQLRGIIYTNLRIDRERSIETVAGTLLPTSTLHHSSAVVYEIIEHMEAEPTATGVLVSHGAEPYLQDFSAVASFALNAICTPNSDLLRRVTSKDRGLSTQCAPSRLVRRVFDADLWCQPEDSENLIAFVKQLIGLKRSSYLAAMRAIRTYVTGLHRVADDLELAYMLLVASIESLAQGFDGHQAEWDDLDEGKRKSIDNALLDAPEDVCLRVRAAILEIEHVSLARRFRDFTLDHLDPTYFRDEAASTENPIRRADLPEALKQAYRARSRYIHNLQELPRLMTFGDSFSETMRVEQTTMLTVQGLVRLARHVITCFVMRQPTVETEEYDYGSERAGVVKVELAPQYWIGRAEGQIEESGRSRLEGFLEQVADVFLKAPNASVTDLRAVLSKIEEAMPTMKIEWRLPYIALYCLYNRLVRTEDRTPNADQVLEPLEKELLLPSSESMMVHLVLDVIPSWDISTHRKIHDAYFKTRHRKKGLRAPRVFEAGVSLALAERCRLANDVIQARELISLAVENSPGNAALRRLEEGFNGEISINWRTLLLPAAASASPE